MEGNFNIIHIHTYIHIYLPKTFIFPKQTEFLIFLIYVLFWLWFYFYLSWKTTRTLLLLCMYFICSPVPNVFASTMDGIYTHTHTQHTRTYTHTYTIYTHTPTPTVTTNNVRQYKQTNMQTNKCSSIKITTNKMDKNYKIFKHQHEHRLNNSYGIYPYLIDA